MTKRARRKSSMVLRIACAIGWPKLSFAERRECYFMSPEEDQTKLMQQALAVVHELKCSAPELVRSQQAMRPTPARGVHPSKWHNTQALAMEEAG